MEEPPPGGSEVVGEKRCYVDTGDPFEHEKKQQKLSASDLVQEVANRSCNLSEKVMPFVIKESTMDNADTTQIVRTSRETSHVLNHCDSNVVSVNKKADAGFDPPKISVQSGGGADKSSSTKQNETLPNVCPATENEVGVNMEKDVAYSSNSNLFYPSKKVSRAQCVDLSECGSVTGPRGSKEAVEKWKKMKQNGFLSSPHSQKVVTVQPVKSRVRKSKTDVMKKKMEQARIEQAKKEQVDRFMKIAAPSGLLNGLNPGIINHVRNSKQVHSIIKALVRPEGHDASANKCSNPAKIKETKGKKELEKINYIGHDQPACDENGFGNNLACSRKMTGHPSVMDDSDTSMRGKDGGSHSHVDTEIGNRISNIFPEQNNKAFKFFSARKMSENVSSMSNEDNQNCVSSLSLKAASVASQWLELLQQDIKGRLAALRRSKKRVHAVLQTELPHLLSTEVPSNQENEPYDVKSQTLETHSSMAELHETRWNSLFGQMNTTLTDEEQQLESWLEQVRDMQLLCDKGMYREHHGIPVHLQSLRGSENDLRLKMGNSEMELAVRAAAASIYSTCNFLMEKENIACSQTR
ncbi:hypothetical protein QQ045_026567 [Rhodiola kirilowii]